MTIERNKSFMHDFITRYDISIVPILVGGISTDKEEFFGRLLAPHLAREDTLCVVSSDFCHWQVEIFLVTPMSLMGDF